MKFILIKIKLSLRSVGAVISRPLYAAYAFIFAFMFMQLILWGINFSVAQYVIRTANITIISKIDFFASATRDVFINIFVSSNALLIAVSVLQGIVIATLLYVIKYNRSVDKKVIGSSVFATALATIGLGCVACGTSLLVPIVAIFASSSAAVITKSLTTPVLVLSILISIFSLYKTGLQASTVIANENSTTIADEEPAEI